MKKTSALSIKTIAKVAVLAAIAVVVMLWSFPILFLAPNFYKLDFSEVIVLLGGFALGPAAACMVEALKILLNLLLNGTSTAYVGEFANLVMGIAFVVPAAIVYHRNKTQKNAIKGLIVGVVSLIIAGDLINYFVLIPAYVSMFHMPLEKIVAMGNAIFPFVTSKASFVLVCVSLFNLFKGILSGIVTLLVYKKVSPILHA